MKAVLGCFGDYDPAQGFCRCECLMVQGCMVWTNYLAVPLEIWVVACRRKEMKKVRGLWLERAKR